MSLTGSKKVVCMVSFNVEDSYTPPKDIVGKKPWYKQTRIFLNVGQYREIFDKKITRFAFIIFIIVASMLLALFATFLHQPAIALIILPFILVGLSWLNYQLLIYSRGINSKEALKQEYLKVEDGWYPDPWSNGVPNRERLFTEGRWSEEIRFKLNKRYLSKIN